MSNKSSRFHKQKNGDERSCVALLRGNFQAFDNAMVAESVHKLMQLINGSEINAAIYELFVLHDSVHFISIWFANTHVFFSFYCVLLMLHFLS